MSKILLVYRDKNINKILVECVEHTTQASTVVRPMVNYSDLSTHNVILKVKYFGAYTFDGAYRYAYSAYVDSSIDQNEITQAIADTIFMMAKKQKIAV